MGSLQLFFSKYFFVPTVFVVELGYQEQYGCMVESVTDGTRYQAALRILGKPGGLGSTGSSKNNPVFEKIILS